MCSKVNIHKLNRSFIHQHLSQVSPRVEKLFYSGVALDEWIDLPKIAVVGSRKMTSYGAAVTDQLVSKLARSGVVIISGLAYGVDARAHISALDNGGLAVAVLPTPIEKIYPAIHRSLARRIENRGSLISEYGPNDPVYKTNFTDRNRIIAGLCDGLLITEAAVNSGSLHTARYALGLGKTVMAVPGSILSPASEGCNNLIKSGAIPVTNPDEILFAIGYKPTVAIAKEIIGTKLDKQIYTLIKQGITDQELISQNLGINPSEINSSLTSLEINGYIKALGAANWTIV